MEETYSSREKYSLHRSNSNTKCISVMLGLTSLFVLGGCTASPSTTTIFASEENISREALFERKINRALDLFDLLLEDPTIVEDWPEQTASVVFAPIACPAWTPDPPPEDWPLPVQAIQAITPEILEEIEAGTYVAPEPTNPEGHIMRVDPVEGLPVYCKPTYCFATIPKRYFEGIDFSTLQNILFGRGYASIPRIGGLACRIGPIDICTGGRSCAPDKWGYRQDEDGRVIETWLAPLWMARGSLNLSMQIK